MSVDGFPHVEVDAQTSGWCESILVERFKQDKWSGPDRDDRREKDEEPEDIDIPRASETVQRDENHRKCEGYSTQDLLHTKEHTSQ